MAQKKLKPQTVHLQYKNIKKIRGLYGSIFAFVLLFFSSCTREYSYEGGSQATYTIQGSPANCSPAVLSGFYIEGTPTTAGDTLQLIVNVTTAGIYTISTLPSNGIFFTMSGNFSDTGKTSVTLHASGIPDSAGSFSINIPGNGGCYFNLNVLKKRAAQYTLAGYPNDCSHPVIGGTFAAGTPIKSSNTVTLQAIVNTPGDYSIATDTVDGVSFSAIGHFSTTGTQVVALAGNGNPQTAGFAYFNVKADSSNCSFSIPVQNAEPLAVYVLQSGVGASGLVCAPQSVEGNYKAGVGLTSTNTITISPYATRAGNYTISTAKVNGMIFSASGSFPAAGNYLIPLKGSGTPLATGDFTFRPSIVGPAPIGGASCDVIVTVQ